MPPWPRTGVAGEEDAEPAVVRTAARVTPRASEPARAVHRVKRGETLSSIAQLYRTNVASLRQANRLTGNVIKAGQRLTVPGRAGVIAD